MCLGCNKYNKQEQVRCRRNFEGVVSMISRSSKTIIRINNSFRFKRRKIKNTRGTCNIDEFGEQMEE
jgi:hypothetical protein